ncbi:hypothetical protein, partial [Escherichia coli]|uniref:hypothetical protein n=1 Tax=Escherichia coli TaxID=562 RepID=UPI0030192FF5
KKNWRILRCNDVPHPASYAGDVGYGDKTRQRLNRQPPGALDVGWGVTALSNLRGGALHRGVRLIRRASVASGNRVGR